ncbi:hypothetical protein H4Q26_013375 [Puccinia striiformis f. sp. tritici PST-130]|nr:hypothetical protein H4Q26_013375 [Puccinia striiformis f. sp. tritici PST-130]
MAGESCKKRSGELPASCGPSEPIFIMFNLNQKLKATIGRSNLGTGQQIAIWNCTNRHRYTPLKLLKGHQAYVTVIKNLGADSLGFVSGDLNGTVLVWAPNVGKGSMANDSASGWPKKIHFMFNVHPATCPDGGNVEASVEEYLIVAGASDGCLTSWKMSITPSMGSKVATTEPIEALQTIQLGNQIALDAALAFIPNQSKHLLLALAGTDNKVAIYSLDFPSLLFSLCFRLPGHTDWVRSAGYPTTQRPLDPVNDSRTAEDPFQTLDELTQALKEEGQLTSHDTNRQTVEMKRYPIKDTRWNFVSDAILYGHESWITNVHWCINPSGSLQLLSTSSDRSMIMWRPSEEFDNIWLNVERFGELGTSTNLGLFGAHYFIGPHDQAETVLASGWTRSWHRWGKEDKAIWEPHVAPTGHYSGVTGLDWEKEGEYLASCSDDQTTRLWGSWTNPRNNSEVLTNPSWHEICRPQAHGHNLFGVSFIGDRRSRFVSISEEKVIRVFDMTQDFCNNRVEDTQKDQKEQQDPAGQQTCPPFEDQLLSHTLWPEIDKIYGHPSELSAITTSHCGRIIASACHATSAQTASIRLHSADDFSPIPPGVLEAHQLTVTRLVFNSDASKLLSVSRDRSWTIWNKSPSSDGFVIDQRTEKAHARVIWDACWATIPSINMFVTGSRDKSVKTWIQSGQDNQVSWDVAHAIKCDQPVKSCAISTQLTQQNKMLLAVGLEDGFISLYMSVNPSGWERIGGVELTSIHHAGPVNRLAFSPKVFEAGKFRLASGGEDEVVQIVDLNLDS